MGEFLLVGLTAITCSNAALQYKVVLKIDISGRVSGVKQARVVGFGLEV